MKKISRLAVLIILTALIINDYFPDLLFSFRASNLVFILVIFVLFAINNFMFAHDSAKKKLKSELFLLLYLAALLILLTLAGGHSTSFLSLDNSILWILFAFDLLRIRFQWKNETKQNEVRSS